MKTRIGNAQDPCPCGSGETYHACCGRFIEGDAQAQTAEQLMRSRYTAYTLGNGDWLRETWHPATRRSDPGLEPGIKWLGLRIIATELGAVGDTKGVVELVARYKIQGRAHRLHERSRFRRREGRWYYVDGDLAPDTTADDDQ